MGYVTKVSAGGRVVIPAEYRKKLAIQTGDEVIVDLEDGALRMVTKQTARKQAQDYVCRMIPPEVLLVQELIRERREEAARE